MQAATMTRDMVMVAPTLSAPSDETREWFRRAAKVADTEDAFVEAVRGELEREPDRALLRAFASEHDWDAIAARFTQVVLEDAA